MKDEILKKMFDGLPQGRSKLAQAASEVLKFKIAESDRRHEELLEAIRKLSEEFR